MGTGSEISMRSVPPIEPLNSFSIPLYPALYPKKLTRMDVTRALPYLVPFSEILLLPNTDKRVEGGWRARVPMYSPCTHCNSQPKVTAPGRQQFPLLSLE